MPIHINEIVVRAVVTEKKDKPQKSAEEGKTDKESMVQEVVEQVLEILKEKEER